jgi:cytochrome b561
LYVSFLQNRLSPPAIAIQIGEWLLLLSAFTAATTAILGLFLSREEGYDAEALMWHKWGGVTVSLLLLSWYGFRDRLSAIKAGTLSPP